MKKIISIVTMIVMLLSIFYVTSYAANSASMRISPSKGEVIPGDELILTFSTIDLAVDGTGVGIAGLEGYFEYDKNIFETITLENNFQGLNGWTVRSYNADTGYILATRDTFQSTADNVFSITTKSKANAKVGITSVKFKNVKLTFGSLTTDETNYELAQVVETQVNIKSSTVPGVSPSPITLPSPSPTSIVPVVKPSPSPSAPVVNPTNTNQNNGNNGSGSITINGGNGSSSGSSTSSGSSNSNSSKSTNNTLPKTGAENFIIPSILVLSIIAIIAYTQYRKMNY